MSSLSLGRPHSAKDSAKDSADGCGKCPFGGIWKFIYEFISLRSCYAIRSASKIKAIAIDSVDMQKRECLYTVPFPLKDAFS